MSKKKCLTVCIPKARMPASRQARSVLGPTAIGQEHASTQTPASIARRSTTGAAPTSPARATHAKGKTDHTTDDDYHINRTAPPSRKAAAPSVHARRGAHACAAGKNKINEETLQAPPVPYSKPAPSPPPLTAATPACTARRGGVRGSWGSRPWRRSRASCCRRGR